MKIEKTMTGKKLSFAVLLIPALVLFAWLTEATANVAPLNDEVFIERNYSVPKRFT